MGNNTEMEDLFIKTPKVEYDSKRNHGRLMGFRVHYNYIIDKSEKFQTNYYNLAVAVNKPSEEYDNLVKIQDYTLKNYERREDKNFPLGLRLREDMGEYMAKEYNQDRSLATKKIEEDFLNRSITPAILKFGEGKEAIFTGCEYLELRTTKNFDLLVYNAVIGKRAVSETKKGDPFFNSKSHYVTTDDEIYKGSYINLTFSTMVKPRNKEYPNSTNRILFIVKKIVLTKVLSKEEYQEELNNGKLSPNDASIVDGLKEDGLLDEVPTSLENATPPSSNFGYHPVSETDSSPQEKRDDPFAEDDPF